MPSERAENLRDILDGKRIPAGKKDDVPARGEGVTADNTKRKPLPSPREDHGRGRHRAK